MVNITAHAAAAAVKNVHDHTTQHSVKGSADAEHSKVFNGDKILWGVGSNEFIVGLFLILCGMVGSLVISSVFVHLKRWTTAGSGVKKYGTFVKSFSDEAPEKFHNVIHKIGDALGAIGGGMLVLAGVDNLELPSVAGINLFHTVPLLIKAYIFYKAIMALSAVIDFMVEVYSIRYAQPLGMTELFDEVSKPIAIFIKVLCIGLLFIIMAGLLARASNTAFHLFLTFTSVATLGAVGVAGAAMKGTASEYQSAIDIMLENLFKVGDEIEVFVRNYGRVRGLVKNVETRLTVITLKDGGQAVIPNNQISQAFLVNHSRKHHSTVAFNVVVDSSADSEKIGDFIDSFASQLSDLDLFQGLSDSPSVSLDSLLPSGYNISVQASIASATSAAKAKTQALLACSAALKAAGLSLAKGSAPANVPVSFKSGFSSA